MFLYEEVFTKRNSTKINEEEINKELSEHISEHKRTRSNNSFVLSLKTIKDIISGLNNGKSVGISGISNEMVKYCRSPSLYELLRTTYEKMIFHRTIPANFNTTIIKPLVKDPKIPADTVTNLRPIAISDVYSTIYEKIVLIEIKKTRIENKKQFGFKSNGSCAHAVFLVVQALKISRQLK